MAIFKSYNTLTPNLGLSDNVKVGRLWGIAGRLDGMLVTEATPLSGGIVNIRLSPGAFLHAGIVVTSDTYIDIGTFSPPSPVVLPPIFFSGTFPVNESVYLVAQSNGPDESALPTFSLLTATQFNAVQDANNFAAILDIYDKRILGNAFEATVPFDGATGGWTLIGPGTKVTALNGTGSGLLSGANTNSDLWALAPLPSIQALDVRFMSLSFFCLSDVATATIATGTVTLGGAVTPGDRLSIFINGFETAHVATGIDTPSTIATALRANLLTNPDVDYLLDPGATTAVGPVITLVTIVKGRQAKFDLATVASPLATTTIVNVPMVGGSQASFVVDFPIATGGVTAIAPVTVYPPPGVGFVQVDVPVDLGDMLVATFNNLNLRAVVTAAGGGFVRVGRVTVLVSYRETNLGIDVAPPSNLAHWRPGSSVAVGSGASTSALGVHRLLNPIDHPDRSITRQKIRIGAVGPQEISPRTVGFNFTEGFHTPADLADPPAGTGVWTITTSDLNLEEISDIVKRLALQGFNSGGSFAIDHDAASGHHRSAKYSEFLAGTNGMLLRLMAVAGDTTLDPTIVVDTTRSQFFLTGTTPEKSPAIYTRSAVLGTLGTKQVIGITSKDVAQEFSAPNREVMLEISSEASAHVARFSRTDAGAKDLYGIKSLDGFPMAGLQSNRMTLFSGSVVYLRTGNGAGSAPWNGIARTNGASIYGADTAVGGLTDTTAGPGVAFGDSFVPDPAGCALYADPKREWDFRSATSAVVGSVTPTTAWIGHFPNPLVGTYLGRDSALGSQWLYLPFFKKDIFSRIELHITFFQTNKDSSTSFAPNNEPNYGQVYAGFLAAPAYDVFEYAMPMPMLTAPIFAPTGTIFPAATIPTGTVRRQPWVLTPANLNRPIGTLGATDNGCYYNPGTGANYDPYAYFKNTSFAAFARASTLNGTLIPSASFVAKGPMPYYDRRTAGGTPGGVLITAPQIVMGLAQRTTAGKTADNKVYFESFDVTVSLPLKNNSNAFLAVQARTPDGIAICPTRFDWGMLGNTNAARAANVNGGTNPGPAVELPGLITIDIVGIVDGRYTTIVP